MEQFALYNQVTGEKRNFTDAKEAGAAFYREDKSNEPSVIHDGRVMARTVWQQAPGEERQYSKTLPNSHAVDAEFRAGYLDALEGSVRERLAKVNWEKDKPDTRLLDDLKELSAFSKAKAASAWKDNAPAAVIPPAGVQVVPERAANESFRSRTDQLEARRAQAEHGASVDR